MSISVVSEYTLSQMNDNTVGMFVIRNKMPARSGKRCSNSIVYFFFQSSGTNIRCRDKMKSFIETFECLV